MGSCFESRRVFAWAGRFGAMWSLFGLLMGVWLHGLKVAACAVGSAGGQ